MGMIVLNIMAVALSRHQYLRFQKIIKNPTYYLVALNGMGACGFSHNCFTMSVFEYLQLKKSVTRYKTQ